MDERITNRRGMKGRGKGEGYRWRREDSVDEERNKEINDGSDE